MKISKIELKNFKRFTQLELAHIPVDSKLVLLIGANGSGKSCVLDSFAFINNCIKRDVPYNEEYWQYYRKNETAQVEVNVSFSDGKTISINEKQNTNLNFLPNSFYGRTSFRQISRLTRTSLGQAGNFDVEKDSDRPKFFIEKDNRFENDIEKITEFILKEIFREKKSGTEIALKYIEPINNAFKNIFGEGNGTRLELINIIPPLDNKIAQITFKKGESEIHYNYLSAGEKEVFNILINLLSRRSYYQDAIFFYDEIDLHLNTKIQYTLLKEICENWIPENCQFWTASHSLGFIEYAKQTANATIIDFDDLDFDLPHRLIPETKSNPEIYEIAVGKEFLPSLFRQMSIYFVENKDKEYYANCGFPNTIFVSDNNRNNVFHKVRTTNYMGIVDRDFLSDNDIVEIKKYYPNLYILEFYSVENYMYHPDNLEEYYKSINKPFDKQKYIADLVENKNVVIDLVIPSLSLKRTEYPYFGEPNFNNTHNQNRFKNKNENFEQSAIISNNLRSNDFNLFYKSLPMKSYCTTVAQRQNISKHELVKTKWFIENISKILSDENKTKKQ